MSAATPIEYLIGIDGGGTSTRARLTDARGAALGEGQAGPSALRRGAAAAWAEIDAAIASAFRAAGIGRADPAQCALGLGLAGAGVPALERAFLAAAPAYARLVLRNDALAAVLGAHGGTPGAVLIGGTGSVLAALDAQGRFRLAGGWGFPAGDEGSGAWIGCLALRHVQHALEGRARSGALAAALHDRCGGTRRALLDFAVATDATALAALAPMVFALDGEDTAAARILDEAADALAALAQVWPGLPLSLAGSVAQGLRPRLLARLAQRRIVEAQADASTGAWRLVAEPALAGIEQAESAAPGAYSANSGAGRVSPLASS